MPVDRKFIDMRAATWSALALVSLVGTIAVVIIALIADVDQDAARLAISTLGGFTTTFGAYALGMQSEVRK